MNVTFFGPLSLKRFYSSHICVNSISLFIITLSFPFFIIACFPLSHLSLLSSQSSSFSSWALIHYSCCFLSFYCTEAWLWIKVWPVHVLVPNEWQVQFDKGSDNAAGLGVSDFTHISPDWCMAVSPTTPCPLPSALLPEGCRYLISSPAAEDTGLLLFLFLSVASSAPFRDTHSMTEKRTGPIREAGDSCM